MVFLQFLDKRVAVWEGNSISCWKYHRYPGIHHWEIGLLLSFSFLLYLWLVFVFFETEKEKQLFGQSSLLVCPPRPFSTSWTTNGAPRRDGTGLCQPTGGRRLRGLVAVLSRDGAAAPGNHAEGMVGQSKPSRYAPDAGGKVTRLHLAVSSGSGVLATVENGPCPRHSERRASDAPRPPQKIMTNAH